MPLASKRLIALIFLLVLTGLAAHIWADVHSVGKGIEADRNACFLHTILLPTLGAVTFVLATAPVVFQQTSPRPFCIPPPFHPPAF